MCSDSIDSNTAEISVDSEDTVDHSGPMTWNMSDLSNIHCMVFSHGNAGF